MTAIEVRDLTVKGHKHDPPQLENIDLSVPEGSVLTVLGPPGAGKTALVRILTGLAEPSSGEILFDESVVNAVRPRQRNVATVMQDYPLVPHKNARENLRFAARLRRKKYRSAIDDNTSEVIDELGLGELVKLRPSAMSNADRQQVAVGRALVRDADTYVFDEPFSALDERIRGHIRSVVVNRQRRLERTTVITTSDPREAMALGAPVAVMHQGIVHQTGTVREIHDAPANLLVAALFGAPAMNLMCGVVLGNELELPLGTLALPPSIADSREDGDVLIAGVRPTDCRPVPVSSPDHGSQDELRLAGTAGEVQWQGATQRILLGFELDEETEDLFAEIERSVQFTMFQPYVMAEIDAREEINVDDRVAFSVPSERIGLFDPLSGDRL